MFLLDGSGTVNTSEFATSLQFIKQVVEPFDLRFTRVGVMQYSHWYRRKPMTAAHQRFLQTHISVGEHRTSSQFESALNSITRHGFTSYLAHAIEKAIVLDMAQSERFGDACTRKALVILLDGRTTDAYYLPTSINIANVWGVNIIAIGVDRYIQQELLTITSRRQEHIFTTEKFSGLLNLAPDISNTLQAFIS
ncbi:vitrin-like [Ciona intestinalis]